MMMRSQPMAIAWGIWARSRGSAFATLGCMLAPVLMNVLFPESGHFSSQGRNAFAGILGFHLASVSLLLTLSIFSYTEVDSQKSPASFPRRLFVLPTTAFQMVFVPMLLGVVTMEILALTWAIVDPELERRGFSSHCRLTWFFTSRFSGQCLGWVLCECCSWALSASCSSWPRYFALRRRGFR
jgi:hypothetical protein